MESPERRSHLALIVTLLACGCGWFLLQFAPTNLPGSVPGHVDTLQKLVNGWPAALIAAFAIGLALPKMTPGTAARWALQIIQWLLTYASVALIVAILFEVFTPRPG